MTVPPPAVSTQMEALMFAHFFGLVTAEMVTSYAGAAVAVALWLALVVWAVRAR